MNKCACTGCKTQEYYDQARSKVIPLFDTGGKCGNGECPCMASETEVEESPVLDRPYQLTIVGPVNADGLEFSTSVDVIDAVNILWQYFGIDVSPQALEED
jgi:hypothetical protein